MNRTRQQSPATQPSHPVSCSTLPIDPLEIEKYKDGVQTAGKPENNWKRWNQRSYSAKVELLIRSATAPLTSVTETFRDISLSCHMALNIVAFISRHNACSSRAESPLEEALKHFPWLETQSGKCNVLSFQKSLAEHSCGAVTPHRRLWRNARRRVEETWMGSRWIKETSWRWFGNKASTSFYVYSTSLPGRSALYMFHQCSC